MKQFLAASALGAMLAGPAYADTDLFVDDDGVQCPGAFPTIQAAVDVAAAMPGLQEIRVCPGTYTENVTIGAGNSVRIEGDSGVMPVVKPTAGTAGPVFDVTDAGRVDIEGLRIDGESAMVAGGDGFVRGIRYTNTDGNIRDNEVLNIRDASGAAQGLGIRIQSSGVGTSNVRVHDNVVRNFTRGGITANGVGVRVRVDGNTVVGPVAPKVWAPNGIQVSRGAHGLVKGNDVRDATSPVPAAGAGSGVLLFCAGPTTVRGNHVAANDLGIGVADNAGAKVIENDVRDSLFDGISLQEIGTFFGPLGCPNFPSPTTGNVVANNSVRGSTESGLSFASFDPDNPDGLLNGNSILENEIRASGTDGVHVFQGAGNIFVGNRIRESADTDAVDDTTGGETAGTGNTWTANRCATSQPVGLCASTP